MTKEQQMEAITKADLEIVMRTWLEVVPITSFAASVEIVSAEKSICLALPRGNEETSGVSLRMGRNGRRWRGVMELGRR